MTMVDITAMNGNRYAYAYGLEYLRESSRSIYCESLLYGDVYRIEKATNKVFKNGRQIAENCEYSVF